MEDNYKIFDLLDRILNRNLQWISAADSKITPVLAIDTAMLSVLAALVPRASKWHALSASMTAICTLLLIVSIICLFLANFPRTQGPKGSMIFFGGISEYDSQVYVEKITCGVSPELLKDLASQCYRNAEIANQKYIFVSWSIILLFLSLPFFLPAVSLLYNIK